MSSEVMSEKIVRIKFDYSTVKQGADTVKTALSNITSKVKELSGVKAATGLASSIKDIGTSAIESSGGVEKLGNAATNANNKFSALKTIATGALLGIGNMAAQQGISILKSLTLDPITSGFNEYELKLKSMQTIMTNTGESVGNVNKFLNSLNDYSDKTIYNFNDMTSAIGSLSTSGMKLADSTSVVKGFFNLAAGTGVEAARASGLLDTAMVQAIQIGKMDYQNWKQLQQAGMGGPKFKDALVANAKAMGKNIDLSNGFNESLKDGWATTDVMLATLKQFENDKSLLNAATKVRSFTQMVDTWGESVGSGWAATWEIIFGNFEEATTLWTNVNNAISPVIDATNNLRNNFLLAFKAAGGFSAIAGIFQNVYNFIKNIVLAVKDAWKSVDVLGTGLGKLPSLLASPFKILNAITKKISEFKLIPKLIGGLFKVLFLALSPVMKLIVRTFELIVIGWNKVVVVFNKLMAVINKIKDGIKSFEFGKNIINPIKEFGSLIYESITSSVSKSIEVFKGLGKAIKSIFKGEGLSAVKSWGKEFIGSISEGFKSFWSTLASGSSYQPIIKGLKALKDAFSNLDVVKKIGDSFDGIKIKLYGFKKALINNGISWKGFVASLMTIQPIMDASNQLGKLKERMQELGGTALDTIKSKWKSFTDFVGTIEFSKAVDWFNKLYNSAKAFVSGLDFTPIINKANDARNAIVTFFTKVYEWAGKVIVLPGIDAIQQVFQKLINYLGSMDGNTIANVLTTIKNALATGFSYIANLLSNGAKNFGTSSTEIGRALADGFKFAIKAVNEFFIGLKDGFNKGMTGLSTIKATLSKWAKSLRDIFGDSLSTENLVKGGLVAYLVILANGLRKFTKNGNTLISSLKESVGSIPEALSQVADAIKNFQKGFNIKNLLIIAGAIGILAVSLKLLSTIPGDRIASTLGLLGASIVTLTAPLLLLSKWGTKIKSAAGNLLALSASLLVLAAAVKIMASVPADDMTKAIIGIAVLMGILTVSIAAMTFKKDSVTVAISGMLGVAAAMLVLSKVVAIYGAMDPIQLGIGLAAMAASLLAIGVAIRIMDSNKLALGTGLSILAMAKSLRVIAEAVKMFGSMNPDQLEQGGKAVAKALLGITVMLIALKSANPVQGALAIGIVALALKALVGPVTTLGSLDLWTLAKGLGSVAILITTITIALKTLSNGGALAGGAAIMLVAMALNMLIPPIVVLGTMKLSTLAQGLIAIAVGLGIVAGIGILAGMAAPGLLAMAVAIGAVALAAAAIAIAVTGLVALMEWLTSSTKDTFEKLMDNVDAFMARIQESIPKFVEFGLALLDGFLQTLVEGVPRIAEAGMQIILGLLDVLSENLPKLIEKGADVVVNFLQGLSDNLPRVVTAAMEFIINFINAMTDALSTYGPQLQTAILNFLKTVVSLILGMVGSMIGAAASFIGGFISSAVSKAGTIWGSVESFFSSLPGKIGGAIGSLVDKASQFIQGFIRGAVSVGGRIWGSISEFFTSIPGKISGAIGNLYDSGASIISGFVSGLTSGLESAKRKVSGALSSIRNLFPFSPAKEGPFSGKGWVLYSGKSILPAFTKGLLQNGSDAVNKSKGIMADVRNALTLDPVTAPILDVNAGSYVASTKLFTNTTTDATITFQSKLLDKFNELKDGISDAFDDSIDKINDRAIVVEQHIDKRATAAVLAEPITNQTKKDELIRKMVEGRGR